MPIFEFHCRKCGSDFEKIIFKPLNEVDVDCPNCGSNDIEKLISAPGSVGVKNGQSANCPNSSSCPSKFT